MRVIQSFEKRLQGAVGNTFARLFGGSVQPAEVADAMEREAARHLRHEGSRVIAPNYYRVSLGPTDSKGLGDDEASVAALLTGMIQDHLDGQGWQTFGEVAVSLEQSDSLRTGQFLVSSVVDPDVRSTGNSRAGAGRMSQAADRSGDPHGRGPDQRPGDPNQYGPPGGYPNYPQQGPPGYSPQGGYQQGPGGPQQPWDQQYGQPQGYPQQYPQGPQPWEQQNYPPPGQWGQQPGYPPQQGYGQPYQQQQYGPPQEIVATLSVDDGSGRTYTLQHGSNVIGRGQEASFRLPDTSVSRRHVDIYFDGHSAVLHDLGSTNGTSVNGSSVQTWQLADGDVIHIGHSTVVYSSRF